MENNKATDGGWKSVVSDQRSVLKFATMTVILELEPDVEMTASELAREKGLPLAEYVGSVVKDAIFERKRVANLSEKSFDEILAPVRKGFKESGETEAELFEFFEKIRVASY